MRKNTAFVALILLFLVQISVSEETIIGPEIEAAQSSHSNLEPDVSLIGLREKIDTINQDILKLLNERAEVVLEIGKLKKENSMEVYDPAREKEIENRLIQINTGPMPDESVIKIFREIISVCRELQ